MEFDFVRKAPHGISKTEEYICPEKWADLFLISYIPTVGIDYADPDGQ